MQHESQTSNAGLLLVATASRPRTYRLRLPLGGAAFADRVFWSASLSTDSQVRIACLSNRSPPLTLKNERSNRIVTRFRILRPARCVKRYQRTGIYKIVAAR